MMSILKKRIVTYTLLIAALCGASYAGAQQTSNTLALATTKTTAIPTDREAGAGQSGTAGTRYTYAELMYQRMYGTDKYVVSGSEVSQQTRTAVTKVKYCTDALEIIGYDGWELVGVTTRNFDSGYEFYYYFKKKLN